MYEGKANSTKTAKKEMDKLKGIKEAIVAVAETQLLTYLRQGSYFKKIKLSFQVLYNKQFPGVQWQQGALAKINLKGANLSGADLSGADLFKANFTRANLSEADLSGADLFQAKLGNADLTWAVLSRAELGKADLSVANLDEANLSKANLSGATLSGAILTDAIFVNDYDGPADFRGAKLSDGQKAYIDKEGGMVSN